MVEHCQTHPGESIGTYQAPKKWHRGALEVAEMAIDSWRLKPTKDPVFVYQTVFQPGQWTLDTGQPKYDFDF